MREHTPGPWKWEYGGLYAHAPGCPRSDDDLCDCPEVLAIGEGYDGMFGGDHPTKADARLIAAAPELLGALENLIATPYLEGWDEAPAVKRASIAIAKARRIAKAPPAEAEGASR